MSERYEFAGVRAVAEKGGVEPDLVPKVVSLKPLVTLSVLAGAFAEHQDAAVEVRQEILATAGNEIKLLEAALATAKAVVQTIEVACASPAIDQPPPDAPIDAAAEPAAEPTADDAPTSNPRRRQSASSQS